MSIVESIYKLTEKEKKEDDIPKKLELSDGEIDRIALAVMKKLDEKRTKNESKVEEQEEQEEQEEMEE